MFRWFLIPLSLAAAAFGYLAFGHPDVRGEFVFDAAFVTSVVLFLFVFVRAVGQHLHNSTGQPRPVPPRASTKRDADHHDRSEYNRSESTSQSRA